MLLRNSTGSEMQKRLLIEASLKYQLLTPLCFAKESWLLSCHLPLHKSILHVKGKQGFRILFSSPPPGSLRPFRSFRSYSKPRPSFHSLQYYLVSCCIQRLHVPMPFHNCLPANTHRQVHDRHNVQCCRHSFRSLHP